ncbi:hypothetical protein BH11PLA2_BH11PLA2_34220 [soil metagenome]
MADVTISNVMQAYAQDAERFALKRGVTLDYSEMSLEGVDALLKEIAGDDIVVPKTADDEDMLWTLSKVYGGYIGEVVIRNFGGTWEMSDNPDGTARVILRCQGIQMFPLEKVYKRLAEDQFSGVSGYCRALRTIIARQVS